MSESILGQAFERFEREEQDRKFESFRRALIEVSEGADPATIGQGPADFACHLLERFNRARQQFPIEAAPQLSLMAGVASPAQAAL